MTQFSSDYQPKERKGRGKSPRTKILEAMERQGRTEEGFYDLLVDRAFNPEDGFAFKELLGRLAPLKKAVMPSVVLELPDKPTPVDKANAVIKGISSGEIPPDVGQTIIGIIKDSVVIEEATDLKARIEELESLVNG